MASTAADSIATAPSSNADAKAPESQSNLPPITKEPMATAEASLKPSTAAGTEAASASAPNAPGAEPGDEPAAPAETETSAAAPEKKDGVIDKTEDTQDSAPGLSNGDSVEPPKPVSVEEVRDQDLPETTTSKSAEMTGALQTEKAADDGTKAEAPTAVTTEVEITEVPEDSSNDTATGDKRKIDEAVETNGVAPVDSKKAGEPPAKKQKAAGGAANGTVKKPGRPRKDKKAPVPVGRTARKTRSQGAAD
ncbi:hypothetical protein GGR56DRAFT_53393 [Xylariaceae sp. FL0804]|nr:hypothetical protein GGR56DRAFT_53393 [Xylariaceae sp. FL0804]